MNDTRATDPASNLPLISILVILLLGSAAAQGGGIRGRVQGADSLTGPAVVWVQGLASGSVPDQDTTITHVEGGEIEPGVAIGFVGREFVFRNEDDTLHNTHLYLQLAHQQTASGRPLRNGATVYNIALPIQGMEARRPIRPYHQVRDETGPIEVKCNAHPREGAFVLVFDHPWATISAPDGRFSIADVPPGKHEIWIWHQGEARRWRSLEVRDGAPTDVIIETTRSVGGGAP